MADVFISYSKARSVEAAELASELADLGYDVWWDTSLLPTGSFGAEIDRQLDAAKAVIVIWSPESLRSKWVRSEASHGDRQDKLVNTHTADPDVVAGIPKPLDLIHSVGLDNIRAIVGALDKLGRTKIAWHNTAAVGRGADYRLFAEVEKSGTAAAYPFYLDEFPQGAHAPVARFKLKGATTAPAPDPILVPAPSLQGLSSLDDCMRELGTGKRRWFKDIDIGPEMVVVPAIDWVTSAPFAIGRFTLTFAEWDAAQDHPDWQRLAGIAPRKHPDEGWGRGKQPAINVSWDDAKAYCKWLSAVTAKIYRLPSEAEWEHACRAGTTTEYSFGDDAKMLGEYAWFNGNSDVTAHPVGKPHSVGEKKSNQWGLFDVHGNVWEWCEDAYNSHSRVVRGGCWIDTPRNLRSASAIEAPRLFCYVGFRLARTL